MKYKKDGKTLKGKPAKGFKRVKNLMSRREIDIPVDTPRSCDPSTELYWTM